MGCGEEVEECQRNGDMRSRGVKVTPLVLRAAAFSRAVVGNAIEDMCASVTADGDELPPDIPRDWDELHAQLWQVPHAGPLCC